MYNFFDLISDIHLDFWVKPDSNLRKMEKKIDLFVDSLIPFSPSNVLVIAGDLGHFNNQNVFMLKSFMRFYESIIVVRGNHDLYLVSGKQNKKYRSLSENRWIEMKAFANDIPNVFVLEGDTITLDGITFGGTGMWYDFSYGIIECGKTREELYQLWSKEMRDRKFIKKQPDFTKEELRFDRIIDESDVIVTHVGGDWSQLLQNSGYFKKGEDLTPSFYFFDGSNWFDRLSGKIWCFGHVHDHYDYTRNGCRFINNAKGYPRDNPGSKIKTVMI
ncbi:putative phosphodiesterase [Paenibacillus sp. 1182]|uniref:metallophosphoesterase family protein n=1 Tax=Paenibacillus sp. 1182 TaxID=2806565 RepID=UPI001AE2B00A|nr:metallophosphoesterase [Paenibacillus sp. 1182]MBP1308943.1 putative phosphodiesterase [Paenibacillus sp. 1182]